MASASTYYTDEEESLSTATGGSAAVAQFPIRLHEMLDQAEAEGFQHIVSWLPQGDGFQIHDQEAMLPILQQCGFKQSKWKSFLRQLQNYGFRREIRGPRKGKCTHDLFIRGRRDLALTMRRRLKRQVSMESLTRQRTTSRGSLNRVTDRLGMSAPSLGLNGSMSSLLGTRKFPTRRNHSYDNDDFTPIPLSINMGQGNATFDDQSTTMGNSNPFLAMHNNGSLYEQHHSNVPSTNIPLSNDLSARGSQQMIWEIQNELAKISMSHPKEEVNMQKIPSVNDTYTSSMLSMSPPCTLNGRESIQKETEPFDYRPQDDGISNFVVDGMTLKESTDKMCSLFSEEPSLEETYG